MVTQATYSVLPDAREIAVSIQVEFTNTTPDPAGQFSVFEVIDLAIHSGATEVAARDSRGSLNVAAAEDDGVNVASVQPRTPVRFEQEMSFTLSYVIPDGAAPDVRVRPSIVIFPAWSFGTQGTVSVDVPVAYEVLVDGDELTAARDGASWRLQSGEVADPTRWLALVTVSHPDAYATLSRVVPLGSGTVDLQVRHWSDDEAWGEATADVLTRGLPALEEALGLSYQRVGPLTVVESLPTSDGGLGETEAGDSVVLAVSFDADPFTILHQAAHVFVTDALAEDRWIREGFASWAASRAGAEQEAEAPWDPEARLEETGEAAFPLVSWGAGQATAEQDAYAYAASWALTERLTETIGEEDVRLAWNRIAAGIGPYEPPSDEPVEPDGRVPVAIDSRQLLDHLETVSGQDLAEAFVELVFDQATAEQMTARGAARKAYAALLAAADEWGGPEPVQAALAGWRFDEAQQRMTEAAEWLVARDRLLADAERVGLAVPARLRDQWQTAGGGPGAQTELDAERSVVDAYATAHERNQEERSIFDGIGLLGGPQPGDELTRARALFAEGELRGALKAAQSASLRLERATTDGVLRLASVLVVLGLIVAAAVYLARRRRTRPASVYTAAP
ncbi:MAG TPA: hypothetical protein VHK28_03240 [Candidatus Limnocylindria bacterium]|nr:hypothetical protein [Candidatus Limnocylindria bacterium]